MIAHVIAERLEEVKAAWQGGLGPWLVWTNRPGLVSTLPLDGHVPLGRAIVTFLGHGGLDSRLSEKFAAAGGLETV